MKKSLCVLLSLLIILPHMSLMACAEEAVESNHGVIDIREADNFSDVYISEEMTFDEMVRDFAKNTGTSFETAKVALTKVDSANAPARVTPGTVYRRISTTLNVTGEYKPRLDFYCEISRGGNFWGIMSIYSVQMYREYNGITKQFAGNVETWLRSGYQIEYIVNGDFYHYGSTTTTVGGEIQVGVGDYFNMGFNVSVTTESNHYAYFYDADLLTLQQ